MERRIIVMKTCSDPKKYKFEDSHLQKVDQRLENYIQECKIDLGYESVSVLTPRDLFAASLDSSWNKLNKVQDIKNFVSEAQVFENQEKIVSSQINKLLDEICIPGSCIVNMIWLCERVPTSLTPELFGALDRAVSYHNSKLTVIPCNNSLNTSNSQPPVWLEAVKAEILEPVDDLKDMLSPSLLWRGGLLIAEGPEQDEVLEDLELHVSEDTLDTVLQMLKIGNLHSKITSGNKDKKETYFDVNMELVCEVDSLSVPQTYLTPHHFYISTKNSEEDQIENTFFEEGFPNSRVGYITRLRISENLAKNYEKRTEENWKRRVIEDTVDSLDNSHLEDWGSYLYFLVYSDPQKNKDDRILKKSVVLLQNNYKDARLKMKYTPRLGLENNHPNVVESVKDLDISSNVSILDVYQYKRDIVAAILTKMLENKSELLVTKPLDELVLGVEESIYDTLDMMVNVHREVVAKKPRLNEVLRKQQTERPKLTSNYCDDISEKQFLRMITKKPETCSQDSDMDVSKVEDTISLEASEILKFFNKTGSPAKHLDLEPVTLGAKCSAYLTSPEFTTLFNKNFDEIYPRKFYYGGFKYIGEDFRRFEFTKYPHVFYHTGAAAEKTDRDYMRMRDIYVGRIKETCTNLDAHKEPEKLKLKQSPAASKSLRRSPRKKSTSGKRIDQRTSLLRGKRPDLSSSVRPDLRTGRSGSTVRSDLGTGTRSELMTKRREVPQKKTAVSSDKEWSRKIRVAVIYALKAKKVEEKHPLFKRCFGTLVKMCQLVVSDRSVGNASELLVNVAMSNAENIIKSEYMKMKSSR